MRIVLPALLLAALAASPALATQGLVCTPETGTGPALSLTIGSGAGPVIVGATLREGDVVHATLGDGATLALGQGWIDATRIWIDLTDANAVRYEAKLRATFDSKRRGRPARGTLTRGGRTWTVRCVEG